MNIIIKKHFLLYKGYKLKCSIGKSGVKDSKKKEITQLLKEYLNLDYFTTEKTEINLLNLN